MDASTRSVVSACLAAVVAVAAFFGTVPLAIVCAALAVVVAFGWPSLLDLPSGGSVRLVVGLAGAGACAVAVATPGEPAMRFLPVVLAMAVVLAFVAELLRADGRPRLVDSLIGTVSGIVVAVACAGWITAARTNAGEALVVTSAVALAAASAVSALRLPRWLLVASTMVVALAAGAGVAQAMPELDLVSGVWAGGVAGLLVAALRVLFGGLPEVRGRSAGFSAAALPVAVGGTLIFVVGRVVVG